IKEKINNRIKHQIKSLENNLYGTYISFSSNYNKIKPPSLNENYIENLFKEGSHLSKLLALNRNAKTDGEKILNNNYRVFNSVVTYHPDENFWNKDFFSGAIYPNIPYTKLKVNLNAGMDYIVSLELSRLQFIPTLIQAHRISNDKKIFNHFNFMLDIWIKNNPYLIGINWNCSMDVGIRSINIGLGIFYFWKFIPEIKREYYLKVLWSHAEYILKHESFKQRNLKQKHNHYLISTVSLLFLCLCFKGENISNYLKRIIEEIKKEIINQFREDGINFEMANHYHQFVVEAIILAEIFLLHIPKNNRQSIFDDVLIKERIEKALAYVSYYMNTNSISPQFGDSSDGRIVFHENYFDWNPLDHHFLFDLNNQLTSLKMSNSKSVNIFYPESGYGFFKNKNYGITFNCSTITENESGHNHLDKASFILQINNNPLFIDSGTYCYTSDFKKRNQYRETRSHNNIMLDGLEQIEYKKTGAFTQLAKIETKIERENGETPNFKLSHDGYKRISNLGLINRIIKCHDNKIEFEDHIDGSGNHLVELIFNLHPDIKFNVDTHLIYFYKNEKELCRSEVDKNLSIKVEESYYSPAYKEEIPSKRIVLFNNVTLPAKFINNLQIS
ncbi:MAG TPA: alginate lyase family protein, partial [Ignavibacteriaceae bacterium]|nr:alginate lyase family protein [Ignavibacteriaceae bacterium]